MKFPGVPKLILQNQKKTQDLKRSCFLMISMSSFFSIEGAAEPVAPSHRFRDVGFGVCMGSQVGADGVPRYRFFTNIN
jgi:hypothetical protein